MNSSERFSKFPLTKLISNRLGFGPENLIALPGLLQEHRLRFDILAMKTNKD